MREDYDWFVDNYKKLQRLYGNCILLIKGKKVIGVFDNAGSALREALEKYNYGDFIIQECSADHDAYMATITSMNFL